MPPGVRPSGLVAPRALDERRGPIIKSAAAGSHEADGSCDRSAAISERRILKRQRTDLEAQKESLEASLAAVNENLLELHQRKRVTRSTTLATFQVEANQCFEILSDLLVYLIGCNLLHQSFP